MRFRLTWYDTDDELKYSTEARYEYLGDRDAIFTLWFLLTNTLKKKHVEVFSLNGVKQHPELGFAGLTDYVL